MVSRQGELFSFDPAPAPRPQEAPPTAAQSQQPSAPAGPKTLTLVDASGFIFRAYHALPPLTTSKGVPTHAVLGFARMLLKLLRERQPTHLALCFDKDSRKGRLAIDPQYKANREAPPADLVTQFGLIRRVADVLNLPILEVEGWEADDVIATMVDRARAKGFQVEIISSDKDLLQLLAEDVRLFDPVKDKPITEADALEKYGVTAAQLRDYQALVGDPIDNIPKVPGIGPKTAAELLKQFGSVDALLARVDEVAKPKTRAALKENREQLLRALELVSFRHDLPLDVDPEALRRRELHQAEARALFTELEFFRLIGEMPAPPPTPLHQEAKVVADVAGLGEVVKAVGGAARVSFAPAFDGEPHSATLAGLGVLAGGSCFYLDVASVGGAAVREALAPALTRPGLEVAAHDGKTLLHLLRSVGIEGVRLATDIELLSYLLNPSRKEHALADLARERLRTELPSWPDGVAGRAKAALAEVPVSRRASFFGAAADAIDRLAPELWTEAEGVGLATLARELELPLVPVLVKMEAAGVLIDRAALAEISSQVDAACGALLQKVYEHAGREFNVGSPIQLAQVLYEELKLPILKKGKTGPSTDHEVLEKLAEEHPLPRAIMEYREVAKLKSTYLDTLPTLIGADGRIRTTFHQAAAATGRLSSTNPNLQNIPIRTELGKQIRRAFVAGPGQVLVSADYSQVELRILAHISGDEGLVRAFSEDADVHARTAAEVFGVAIDAVTADQRRAAKMVNYGIAYGLSAHGLSTRLNIPVEEAKSIIDRYFARFPGIARYVDETIEKAKRSGYVESLFGRRRYMPDLVSRNRAVAMAAERAAINMPIQGTAADLVKRAMLELDRAIPAAGLSGRMLLQVHDELLFESPEGEAAALAAQARRVMAQVAELRVPLVVDVGTGRSWAEAH
ncbi:MAG: DNA polymerase I [Myxococcota bacterium]